MRSIAIVGAQWGDEGKGKITDLLSEKSDIIIRYQGGSNAGHTIWVGDKKIVLHVIPSGILRSHCVCMIGHGVVFEPQGFKEELDFLLQNGIDVKPENLKISGNCTVTTSYNRILDEEREKSSNLKIGTTGRGVGPTYEDKASRTALKLIDLRKKEKIAEKLKHSFVEKEILFKHLYNAKYPSIDEEVERLFELGKMVSPFISDTFGLLDQAASEGKKIIFEGAQGVLLDIDYGSYPYVTSSSTGLGGIYTGAGVPGHRIDEVIGITKAYTTRVGLGPFPTEINDKNYDIIQERGKEFGATTGRKRRCGWLDLPLLEYAVKASNITSIALTKLDVLAGMDELKVCYGYKYKGKEITIAYPGIDLNKVEPLMRDLEPFNDDFKVGLEASDLSPQLMNFITTIENYIGIPVKILAFGPERKQIFFRKEYF